MNTKNKDALAVWGFLFGSFGLVVVVCIVGFFVLGQVSSSLNSAFSTSFSTVRGQLSQMSVAPAILAYRTGDYPAMLEAFKQVAKSSPDAANAVGEAYELGLGTQGDIDEAKAWYKRSADQGCQAGKSNLQRLTANPNDRMQGSELPCIKTTYAETCRLMDEAEVRQKAAAKSGLPK